MAQTYTSKPISKWVLYIGLILLILGGYFVFSGKKTGIGYIAMFIGAMMAIFQWANNKSSTYSVDDNGNITELS